MSTLSYKFEYNRIISIINIPGAYFLAAYFQTLLQNRRYRTNRNESYFKNQNKFKNTIFQNKRTSYSLK